MKYIQESFFNLSAILAVISALLIYINKNPIYSIIFLILTFIFCSFTLISIGADFLGILLIIIYVGAITVLMLFIIMTLNIRKFNKFSDLKHNSFHYVTLFFFIGYLLFGGIIMFNASKSNTLIEFISNNNQPKTSLEFPYDTLDNKFDNVTNISYHLYTEFAVLFILAAFILLIAMMGSIVIAQQGKTSFKKQKSFEQINQNISKALTVHVKNHK